MKMRMVIAFLMVGIASAACSPAAAPAAATPSDTPTTAVTLPVIYIPTPTPAPSGDHFIIAGYLPVYGILIEKVDEDAEWISVTYWDIENDGYVYQTYLGSSKSQAGSENNQVVRVSLAERLKVMANWQKKGYTVQVTDLDDKTSEVSNVFLALDLPNGYRWANGGQSRHTSILLTVDGTENTTNFDDLSELTATNGAVKLTLKDGSQVSGLFGPYTAQGLSMTARVYGIQYAPDGSIQTFNLPFEKVKSIRFLVSP